MGVPCVRPVSFISLASSFDILRFSDNRSNPESVVEKRFFRRCLQQLSTFLIGDEIEPIFDERN